VNEIIWGSWLVIFLFFEIKAAFNKVEGDTLSETVGDWTGVPEWSETGRKFSKLRRGVLFIFLVSLTLHLVWATTVLPVIVFGAILSLIIGIGIFKEKS
jgi:hypothetical protein